MCRILSFLVGLTIVTSIASINTRAAESGYCESTLAQTLSLESELPHDTIVRSTRPDESYVLTLRHEIVSDPRVETTFNVPADVAVSQNGTVYYLDAGDRDIKVFSEDLRFVGTIGRPGEGPGEFQSPWRLAISPAGELLVYDSQLPGFHVFSAVGEFLYSIQGFDRQFHRQPQSFVVLDGGKILVSAGALALEMYRKAIHRFQITRSSDHARLVYEGSFGRTVDYDPSLYRLIGGQLSLDTDGQVLYAQRNPYSLRKYSRDGDLIWALDDPDAMRPAYEYFTVGPYGRVAVRVHARSVMLARYDESYLVHVMMLPPFHDSREGGQYKRRIELVPEAGADGDQISFIFDSPFLFYDQIDQERRLYGYWSPDELTSVPIRSQMIVEREHATWR